MVSIRPSGTWAQRTVLAIAVIAVIAHGYILAFVRVTHIRDFDVHRILGQRFLTHFHLYDTGYFGYPYMPIAAMYFAPLAFFQRPAAFALRYFVAVVALAVSFVLLQRMMRQLAAPRAIPGFWVAAITVVLALQFILQDLDDGGPHLILLGLLTAAIYFAWQAREKLAATLFGFAIAVKITPGLFMLYFLWKGRWRLAAYTAVATICWISLPIIYMEPDWWWMHQKEWTEVAAASFIGKETPWTQENEQRVRNQSLRQTLMRYLVTLPENDPVRLEDTGYVPLLNLRPSTARVVATILIVSLIVVLCWMSRRPSGGRGDPEWVRETSAVMIVALLLSPVTWVQHLVWLIPALYVVVTDTRATDRLGWGMILASGVYIMLALVLNHEVLGKHNFERVLTFHPYTIAMGVVLAILMVKRGTEQANARVLRQPAERDLAVPQP